MNYKELLDLHLKSLIILGDRVSRSAGKLILAGLTYVSVSARLGWSLKTDFLER